LAAAKKLTSRLGVELDPDLLVLALTHRSFAYENGGLPSNERLEFLGDSVLSIVVTDRLYRDHPDLPEGQLAPIRAATVSQRSLAAVARDIGLGPFVLLGKGEMATGGANKDSILCDTLEALFGAVYLAHGIETSRTVILDLLGPTLRTAAHAGVALDWKTSLQELCAAHHWGKPVYEVEGEGPAHMRTFTATVLIDGVARGTGTGSAKKLAEYGAAEAAFRSLEQDLARTEGAPSAGADADAGAS